MAKRRVGKKKTVKRRPAPVVVKADGVVDWLTVVGAGQNNLRKLDVAIPLGRFVCVTGVSGSGKSSLVNEILYPVLARELNGATKDQPGKHERIDGLEHLDKVIDIDQSPIGRTPRSNPATYIKVFDLIRSLYTKLPEARLRGYKPGRFSFNVHTGSKGGGRCEACEGNGAERMDMDFLADVWVTCPVCGGQRFSRETLQIRYRGKSIADVLAMEVDEALKHFGTLPRIEAMLRTLHEVGLGYLKLGQPSSTLSGGEAQRIKLARELVKKATGRTLYLLDEPTTGLHFHDIRRLLKVLHGFVDAGNSVLVIEHNLDVVKTADWVIDLGPEGGAGGGRIVSQGSPEQIAKSKRSHTGAALREVLNGRSASARATARAEQAAGEQKRARGRSGVKAARSIEVVGARQHNLKDIDVSVPRGQMTVCCGPSGSGKTSFALDTVYAEGQRRYVESLSAYARQFLGRLQPPRVDHVHGLAPAIALEQRTGGHTSRSTVGTVTEVYDYLRVLWARIGQAYCPRCEIPIGAQSSEEIVERVLSLGEGRKVLLLAPLVRKGTESYSQLFETLRGQGYARVRVDGVVHELNETIDVDAKRAHELALVIDRIVLKRARISRLTDSIEQALAVGNGVLLVERLPEEAEVGSVAGSKTPKPRQGETLRFSRHRACERCGTGYEELTPHHFSFNSRLGWCETCEGIGVQLGASPAAIVVHPTKSILDGAIIGWGKVEPGTLLYALVEAVADRLGFDANRPWNKLLEAQRLGFLHGSGPEWIDVPAPPPAKRRREDADNAQHNWPAGMRVRWRGFLPALNRISRSSWQYRKRLETLVTEVPCEVCGGGRLRADAAAVRVQGRTLRDVCSLPLGEALAWFTGLKLDGRTRVLAGELVREVTARVRFLVEVGLDYVTLNRSAGTLSGGEAQRIRLAAQLGTGLTGVLYVLDEPTVGLHPRDNRRLIRALHQLRDLGNTLLVVEHDREIIDSADQVLDFGPGAGMLGGRITAQAAPGELRNVPDSLTGRYLSGLESIPVPQDRRAVGQQWLTVCGAREHNLKEIDVEFPVGVFTCVTGVSGSGKSSLVTDILYNALAVKLHRARLAVGAHERIRGRTHINKVINVDQAPIGNTPTSNPATYTNVFEPIRQLFARVPLSRTRGYRPGRFSFLRPGGRCEACAGMGQQCIEMHFLPDVWITCESCGGTRYVEETLEVRYRGKSIADVLTMSVSEALRLFENVPKIKRILQTLDDVGLGYLQLGQSASTLSGGEAQRVKLAAELSRPSTGQTLYVLDEPTTGLHFDDLKKLLNVIRRLVDQGNTCICIEHNLDVIKSADWVIDLGPEAGDEGGHLVAAGTPEGIVRVPESHTGTALAPVLEAGPYEQRPQEAPKKRARSAREQAKQDLERILARLQSA